MASTIPAWKRLFGEGGFAWSFRMRSGQVDEFFAPTPDGPSILEERRHCLSEAPDRYLAETPAAAPLIRELHAIATGAGFLSPSVPSDLRAMAQHLEPDLLLVDAGSLALVAACVCFPSSWNLHHAMGKPIHQVHEVVPQLNPSIGPQIERFLRSVPPGKAFLRENWSLTHSAHRNYHPDLNRPKLDASTPLESIHLRLEHQLFTAIPGGILMGIRIGTCPLTDLRADQETWRNLTEIIRTMPDDVAAYKSMLAARDAIAAAMGA